MTIRDLIRTRREGGIHTAEELTFLADGAAKGTIPDYQLSAWLMAAYLRPLSKPETVDLTLAMAASGERIDLTGLPEPWVDKHSTGGVGDKTTIVLLPLLAACGLTVVKMSGRGLGITGGTVDKLESIPGFRTDLSIEEMKAQAGRIGLALTGQTPRLAPADGALYALRDVTETVDSIPLIAASILSKKIAGGAKTVILDVKCGAGAFMTDLAKAKELKRWLVEIGEGCGLRVAARITDMEEPLGGNIGNACEVAEAISVLHPRTSFSGPETRLRKLCIEFAVLALVTSGVCGDEEARRRVDDALASGRALDKARSWFRAQGAERAPATTGSQLEATFRNCKSAPLFLSRTGWISRIDARRVGEIVVELGGGRAAKGDAINHAVSVILSVSVGDPVGEDAFGRLSAGVVWAKPDQVEGAAEALVAAIEISDEPVAPRPLFLD